MHIAVLVNQRIVWEQHLYSGLRSLMDFYRHIGLVQCLQFACIDSMLSSFNVKFNFCKIIHINIAGIDATLVELVVHTKRIQHQTMVLASICGCPFSSAGKGSSPVVSMDVDGEGRREQRTFELPEAADLLGLLHRALLEADNILGPMIRCEIEFAASCTSFGSSMEMNLCSLKCLRGLFQFSC